MADRYELCNSLSELVMHSNEPLEEIKYVANRLSELWSMHHDRENIKFSICVGVLKQ